MLGQKTALNKWLQGHDTAEPKWFQGQEIVLPKWFPQSWKVTAKHKLCTLVAFSAVVIRPHAIQYSSDTFMSDMKTPQDKLHPGPS